MIVTAQRAFFRSRGTFTRRKKSVGGGVPPVPPPLHELLLLDVKELLHCVEDATLVLFHL